MNNETEHTDACAHTHTHTHTHTHSKYIPLVPFANSSSDSEVSNSIGTCSATFGALLIRCAE